MIPNASTTKLRSAFSLSDNILMNTPVAAASAPVVNAAPTPKVVTLAEGTMVPVRLVEEIDAKTRKASDTLLRSASPCHFTMHQHRAQLPSELVVVQIICLEQLRRNLRMLRNR